MLLWPSLYTVKPVLSDHSKIDKTKILKTYGSLMKVESIAECSFCNTFDLHLAIIGLENQFFGIFESGRFRQVLLYHNITKYVNHKCFINFNALC